MTAAAVRDDTAAPDATAARPRGGRLGRLLLAAVAGLLLDLAFPPHGWWPLAVLAVALLALACRDCTTRTAAWCGAAAGATFFGPLLVWTGAVAGPPAWLALVVLETLFLAGLGAAMAVLLRLPGWPLWLAAAWVGQEALRSRVPFGGFPWGRLAFSQGGTPFTPLAAWGGAPLVTAGVAVAGGVLAAVVVRRPRDVAAGLAGLAVLGLLVATAPGPVGGSTAVVAVVQGNVPRLGLDAFAQRAAVLGNHVAATHELAGRVRAGDVRRPDLVVWPENASDLDPYTDRAAAAAIDGAVRDVGVPVLVGAVVAGPGRKVRNMGIVWDPVSGPGASYVKRHPVPFGEYIPFRGLVRAVTDKVDLVPRDFAAGDHAGVLTVGPARLGDVICFEVAYDSLVRDAVRGGGRLLVVQTNNATFGRSGETVQQLEMSRLRAVESRRTVLVAATSGVSAVIDPDGRVRARSEVFRRRLLVEQVPLSAASTPATRVGSWPELALSGLAIGALAVAALTGARARG